MIVGSLLDMFFGLLNLFLEPISMLPLPADMIQTLTTISGYGVWVVGADLMSLIISTVMMWWTIKLTIGIVIWLWELLPLT